MKKTYCRKFWLIFFCLSSILIGSCVRSGKDLPKENTIFLEELHAKLPDTDMSLRQDYQLIVGNKDYTYRLSNGEIIGEPGTEPYIMEKVSNSLEINFYRRDFPANDKNDVTDQSTLQKIVRADPLQARYSGVGSKKVDVSFKHLNMLMDFEVQGTTKELQLIVSNMKPYKLSSNRFQIVYFYHGGADIRLLIGGKLYDAVINSDPFVNDQHKKFVVQYDAQQDKISVVNGPVTTWSTEKWPE